MVRRSTGFGVSRHLVLVLDNGSVVVQWDNSRVHDIESGENRTLTRLDHLHPASDDALERLKSLGRLERYDRAFVWLTYLPENQHFPELHVQERSHNRVRAFYLNTTLGDGRLDDVQARIDALGLSSDYGATNHGALVAVMRTDGTPFPDLKAAENAQRQLVLQAYDVFKDSVVAFVDQPSVADSDDQAKMRTTELVNLSTIIASQSDVNLTHGKRAVLAVADDNMRAPMLALLAEMGIETQVAGGAAEALALLEDTRPHLLVTDLQLPEMHAWELLAKAREIDGMGLLTAVIAEAGGAEPEHHSFGSAVAHVDAYLIRPFSMARFRLSIWLAFQHQAGTEF